MSGHSKWAQIKRQKGVADVKRGAAFTKLSNAITIAVKQNGGIGDPDQNFKLRLIIETARNANMPKENIERAIARAAGKQGSSLEEVVYEGFGPGGIAVIVEAATDNKNRTTGEVQNIFNKNGGHMGERGSVSYLFKQIGQIILSKENKSIDDIFLEAADSGAEDVEEVGEEVFVDTNPHDLNKVRESLVQKGYKVVEANLIYKPIATVSISDKTDENKATDFLSKLDELDDVQQTYSNIELS